MMRVMVTGGSGFIGTNLIEHFRARGDVVANIDILPPRNPEHAGVWHAVDILDRAALARAVSEFDPDVVFHMAARTDLDGITSSDYVANTAGVSNLIQSLARLPRLRCAVFASSMLVCRPGYVPEHEADYCPNTFYGQSKAEGEACVRVEAAGSIPWLIVRPTSIWGPWFRTPYRDFFEAVGRRWYMHPRGRRIRRSYGFVLNSVLQLDRLASTSKLIGNTIYLADYEPIELKRWADAIASSLDAGRVREVPLWVLRVMGRCGDALRRLGYGSPPMTSARLNNLLTEMVHDTTALRAACGEVPYSMDEGVRITCSWLRREAT